MSENQHETKLSEFLSAVELENGDIELRGYYRSDDAEGYDSIFLTPGECGTLVAYLEGVFE